MSKERIRFRAGHWPTDEAERDQLTRRAVEDARSDSLPKFLPDHALAHLSSLTEELVDATVDAAKDLTKEKIDRVGRVLARLKTVGLRLPKVPD